MLVWYGILFIGLLAIIARAVSTPSIEHRVVFAVVSAFVLINLFYATEAPALYFGVLGALTHLKIFPLLLLAGAYLAGFYSSSKAHPRVKWWWNRVAWVSFLGLTWGLLTAGFHSCKTHTQCSQHFTQQASGTVASDYRRIVIDRTSVDTIEFSFPGTVINFDDMLLKLPLRFDWQLIDTSTACYAMMTTSKGHALCPGREEKNLEPTTRLIFISPSGKTRRMVFVTSLQGEKRPFQKTSSKKKADSLATVGQKVDSMPREPRVEEQQGMSFKMADKLMDSLVRYGQGVRPP